MQGVGGVVRVIIRQSANVPQPSGEDTAMTTTTSRRPDVLLPADDDRGIYGEYLPTKAN
jgi:hypothetical protein